MNRKRMALLALALGVVVFFLNKIAGVLSWYWIVWWFDMPMHFLGGFFSAILLFLFLGNKLLMHERIDPHRAFLYFLLGVFVLGLLWEFHEAIVERAIPGVDLVSLIDSLSDLCFDIAGGLLAYHMVWKRRSRNTLADTHPL